jgi:hypothetical protein
MDVRSAERAAGMALQVVVGVPAVATLAVLLVAVRFTPESVARGDHLAWVGLPLRACGGCGLCGMSRALAALLHGDLAAAWQFNPGVFVTGPLLVGVVVVSLWGVLRIRRTPPRFFPSGVQPDSADKETVRACY